MVCGGQWDVQRHILRLGCSEFAALFCSSACFGCSEVVMCNCGTMTPALDLFDCLLLKSLTHISNDTSAPERVASIVQSSGHEWFNLVVSECLHFLLEPFPASLTSHHLSALIHCTADLLTVAGGLKTTCYNFLCNFEYY